MLSDKLFELAKEVRRQGDAAGEDCDCRAYDADFYSIADDIAKLAEEAKAEELEVLVSAGEREYREP